ncbi:hypothetical protein, partial [Pontibacter cellulosilyticus]
MHVKFLLKQMAKWRSVYIIAFIASLSFYGVSAFNTYEPTVMSDKDDYSPGEVAIITGYGWTQDSLVDIHLEEDPAYEHHHAYHDTKVNPDGSWRIEYLIEERHLGTKFTVIVEGKQSGVKAYTYFTDGVSINIQSGSNPVCSGGSITLRASIDPGTGGGGSYVWKKDGNNIVGATSRDLVLSNFSSMNIGEYQAVYTKSGQSYSSNTISLLMPTAPVANASQAFCSAALPKVSDLSAAGSNLKWY